MNLSDQELVLYAIREAQLILSEAATRDRETILQELNDVLGRPDVVEAVDRLEASVGLRLA